MPNDGNRIYTETVNGVKYGVDVQNDIYKVLGIGPYNGEYYDVTWACINRHGKTNKWSRFKPVRTGTYMPLLPEDFACPDKHYGLLISASASLLGSYDSTCWTYLPPRVDTDQCRADDFDGYCHNAQPIARAPYKYGEVIRIDAFQQSGKAVGVTLNADKANGLALEDFTNDLNVAKLRADLYSLDSANVATPHDRSKWNFIKSYESTAAVSTGSASAMINFPIPDKIVSDATRPFWIVTLALSTNAGYYPLPYDNDHFWYGFYRPYLMRWVDVTSGTMISLGRTTSLGNLSWSSYYTGVKVPKPTNWNGTVYVKLNLNNNTTYPGDIFISPTGGLTTFRTYKILQGSTLQNPLAGTMCTETGAQATDDVILAANHGNGTIRLKFPQAVSTSFVNQSVTMDIEVSHNSGKSFAPLTSMTFTPY